MYSKYVSPKVGTKSFLTFFIKSGPTHNYRGSLIEYTTRHWIYHKRLFSTPYLLEYKLMQSISLHPKKCSFSKKAPFFPTRIYLASRARVNFQLCRWYFFSLVAMSSLVGCECKKKQYQRVIVGHRRAM